MSQIDYCSSTLLSHGVNSLAFDGDGNLYATNFQNGAGVYRGTIVKITPSGVASLLTSTAFAASFPACGLVYSYPQDCLFITANDTKVYKVNKFGGELGFTVLSTACAVGGAQGIIASGANYLIVCCNGPGTAGGGAVYKIDAYSGALFSTFILGTSFTGYPNYIAVTSTGNYLISDYTGNKVYSFFSNGLLDSVIIPSVTSPGTIAVDSAGNIYLTNNSTNYVLKYSSTGTLISNTFAVGGKSTASGPKAGGLTFDNTGTYYYVVTTNNVNDSSPGVIQTNRLGPLPGNLLCFKEGTKILCRLPNGAEGYRSIERLQKGDLVKTLNSGYQPIYEIGYKEIYHPAKEERVKDQLYKCSKDKYPELFEDLLVTGCHSILVDSFTSQEQREKTIEVNGDTFVTDNKYRLPTCADNRAKIYETPGNYKIYHFALEHEDYYVNYGVYANGLLVESCSKRNLLNLSNMKFLE
jgi:hypothetical protein